MNSTISPSYYTQALPGLQRVYRSMNLYLSIFILIPGWFLNFVLVGVYARKRFWRRSDTNSVLFYYYTIYPLICNLVVTIAILNFFPAAFGTDLTMVGQVEICRLIWFLRLFLVIGAQYFEVQMTIDRTISIVYPRRFNWLSKIGNLVKLSLLVMLFASLAASLQLFRYYTYKTLVVNNATVIVPAACVLSTTLLRAYNISNFFIRSSGFVIITISNFLIIRKLVHSKRMVNARAGQSNAGMSRKEVSLAVSLLLGNFLHTLLVAPFIVLLCIQLTYTFKSDTPPDFAAFISQWYSISNWGNYIYEASQFYVSLAWNKVFRAELFGILSGTKKNSVTETGIVSKANSRARSGTTTRIA